MSDTIIPDSTTETRTQIVNRAATIIRDAIERSIVDLTGIEVLYILTRVTHSYSVDALRVERADRRAGE